MEPENKLTELEEKIANLEARLKVALQQDDEPDVTVPLRGTLVSTFKGEMTKFASIAYMWLFVCIICAAGCYVAFSLSGDVKHQLLYITCFNISIMGTVLIKLWYWIIWNRYSIVREVKRLEYRIAELSEKISKR